MHTVALDSRVECQTRFGKRGGPSEQGPGDLRAMCCVSLDKTDARLQGNMTSEDQRSPDTPSCLNEIRGMDKAGAAPSRAHVNISGSESCFLPLHFVVDFLGKYIRSYIQLAEILHSSQGVRHSTLELYVLLPIPILPGRQAKCRRRPRKLIFALFELLNGRDGVLNTTAEEDRDASFRTVPAPRSMQINLFGVVLGCSRCSVFIPGFEASKTKVASALVGFLLGFAEEADFVGVAAGNKHQKRRKKRIDLLSGVVLDTGIFELLPFTFDAKVLGVEDLEGTLFGLLLVGFHAVELCLRLGVRLLSARGFVG